MITLQEILTFIHGIDRNACISQNARSLFVRVQMLAVTYYYMEYERNDTITCDVNGTPYEQQQSFMDKSCLNGKDVLFSPYNPKKFSYLKSVLLILIGVLSLSKIPDGFWYLKFQKLLNDTIDPLKKKEEIHSFSDSSKKIEAIASHFYESYGVDRFHGFLAGFICKTISHLVMDIVILQLLKVYFETSSMVPSYSDDFPLSALCHFRNEHFETNLTCYLNINEGLRKVIVMFAYGHLCCFAITCLVLIYYIFLFSDSKEVTSKKKLIRNMKAPLYKLIDNSEQKYTLPELFVLYYISYSGIEPVTFKIFIAKYELLKNSGQKEFELV